MKDPSESIRQWLYDILNKTITYNGQYLSCFSFVPKGEGYPFIVLGEQYLEADTSTKDLNITQNAIDIEIYASYSGNDASYKLVNAVGEDVMELVLADPETAVGSGGGAVTVVSGYSVVVKKVASIATQKLLYENALIIKKVININLELEEN